MGFGCGRALEPAIVPRRTASAASLEELLHQVAHDLRVRRPLRLFHGLPHEVSEQPLLPRTILAGLLRVRGDDPFAERTQRPFVGYHAHAARLDDLPRTLAGPHDGSVDLLGLLAAAVTALHKA